MPNRCKISTRFPQLINSPIQLLLLCLHRTHVDCCTSGPCSFRDSGSLSLLVEKTKSEIVIKIGLLHAVIVEEIVAILLLFSILLRIFLVDSEANKHKHRECIGIRTLQKEKTLFETGRKLKQRHCTLSADAKTAPDATKMTKQVKARG
jgi:hypothetical protein